MREKTFKNPTISYLIALSIFAVVCMLRFFDREIGEHDVLFSFMNSYAYSIVITFVYIASFVVLVAFSFRDKSDTDAKRLYYLFACAAIFVFSMYWNEDYLGVTDIYAYMLCFISMILLIKNKGLFLIPIFSALGIILAPISIFSVQLLVVMIMLLLTQKSSGNYLKGIFVADLVAVTAAMIIRCVLWGFDTDVIGSISTTNVIMMAILFIPAYLLLGVFIRCITHNKLYVLAMILGLVGPVVEGIIGDPVRAIFYGFTYYFLLICVLYTCNNQDTVKAIDRLESIIGTYIAWPAIIPAYLFVIVTIWISGPLKLFKEIIVGT